MLTRCHHFWLCTGIDSWSPRTEAVQSSACPAWPFGNNRATRQVEDIANFIPSLMLTNKPITIFVADQGGCIRLSVMCSLIERERSGPRLLTAYWLNGSIIHESAGYFPLGTLKIIPKDPVNLVIELVVMGLPTADRASSGMCQWSEDTHGTCTDGRTITFSLGMVGAG